jgi:Peptidase family M23
MSATAAAAAGREKPEATAIFVKPIHEAQVVRGDDGKDHVEYDLLVDNAVGDPVTLTSVTVLDPAGKELGRVDGNTLAAATQNLYTHAPVPAIPSSGAVAVEVDLALAPGTVPARITNRIAYTLAPGAESAATIGATEGEVDGPEVAVNRRPAIVIKQPPLAGDGWLVTTACCGPNPHRDLRLAIDGRRIETGETFAVDWGRVRGNKTDEGDGSTNEQSYAYGADVLAVADGTVVFTQDGEPEQTPGEVRLAEKQSQIGGNKVILKIAPKVFAAYQHLQPGLTVKVGDKVKAGAVLAKLGNTGPSTGAHLHFGLLDRPDVFTGRALPFVFDRYTLAGTVDVANATGDELVISPESRQVRSAYPLWGSIQNFP